MMEIKSISNFFLVLIIISVACNFNKNANQDIKYIGGIDGGVFVKAYQKNHGKFKVYILDEVEKKIFDTLHFRSICNDVKLEEIDLLQVFSSYDGNKLHFKNNKLKNCFIPL